MYLSSSGEGDRDTERCGDRDCLACTEGSFSGDAVEGASSSSSSSSCDKTVGHVAAGKASWLKIN